VVRVAISLTNFIPSLAQAVVNFIERFMGYVVLTRLISPEYEKLSLKEIVSNFAVDEKERAKLIELLEKDRNGMKPALFVNFLKDFNIRLAKTSMAIGYHG